MRQLLASFRFLFASGEASAMMRSKPSSAPPIGATRVLVGLTAVLAAAPAALAQTPLLPDLLASLAPGLAARVLIRAGDPLPDKSTFSPKNDLTAYIPLNARDAYLMVGHEIRWGTDPLGGRLTRLTLRDGQVVSGQLWASGMNNNCAGSLTPWKTVLTCEEYPHDVYHEADTEKRRAAYESTDIAADDPRASFGWTYEVDPQGGTPAGRTARRTAMGRFSHESTEVVGDRTVYLTEDYDPGYFWKFVADRPKDLSAGKLYAYQRDKRRWLLIRDVVNAHRAAEKAGATKFIRLEDVKLGPDGALYIAETGHFKWNDPLGRVLRLDPRTNQMTVFAEGDGTWMAQPDNLVFDGQGRLLVCEDQYNENVDKFGPNEVLRREKNGTWTRLASTVKGSEPTGPSFTPDMHQLIMSVMWGPKSGIVVISGL